MILLLTITTDTLGRILNDKASVEVIEVVAPVDGAIALLVLPERKQCHRRRSSNIP